MRKGIESVINFFCKADQKADAKSNAKSNHSFVDVDVEYGYYTSQSDFIFFLSYNLSKDKDLIDQLNKLIMPLGDLCK